MAVVAAGENPEQFAGLNLMDKVQGYYSATLGAFGDPTNVWHQAMAILGLAAAGEPVPVTATATLRTLQQANGGWGYSAAWDLATADNTALAMQALAAAGEPLSSTAMVSATAFLRATQDTAGGWDNANTTAFAIQGLVAAGEDVQASKWRRGGRTPVAALEDYQKPDGPFRFGMADSAFATRQAVPALLGLAFPVAQPDGTLSPWQPVVRGPDPDRLVVGRLRYDAETRTLVVPFGSDWDGDAQATVTWLLGDARAAVAFRMLRGTHRFTATLPMRGVRVYDAYVQATDSQGVQGGTVQRLRNRWRSVGPRALNDRGLRIASLCWID
jgi:hypothetical protein